MKHLDDNEDTRQLIKKILNKKDPAIVGLKKILHSKQTANPEKSFSSHVPEVFNASIASEGEAHHEDSLFNDTEKQIIEHEHEILELRSKLEELENNLDAIRQEAFNEGFEKGSQEISEQMQEQFQDELAQQNENYAQQLSEIVAQQLDDRNNQFRSLEPLVLNMAISIAKKIVDDSIVVNQEIIEKSIRNAISHIAGRSEITVRVSPEDQEFAQSRIDAMCDTDDSIIAVRVEGSANIKKGGCLIETDTGIIDATIDNQICEIEQCIIQSWQEFSQKDEEEAPLDEPTDQLY